ncbi:L-histidine N(alpha)-methyltransferase [Labilibacter marinus]|uniref:L-histidine N(alpha)-methyltransferase n=1 Tax=Labilibacter marinus TaxID=1477105 RepID=UPI0009500DEA|nr:L-histidine N(alpha)-methyltransferase [Labilibacter marinus]
MNYSEEVLQVKEQVELVDILQKSDQQSSIEEIKTGLLASKKYISPKYFYDEVGSKLFEEITQLQEYYPTNTEKRIISNLYADLKMSLSGYNVVELGSGDHTKISLFLNQVPKHELSKITYCPVDISKSAIKRAASHLSMHYPELLIRGVVADFIQQLSQLSFKGKNLFLFLGSTIGNLSKTERQTFMQQLSQVMKPGDKLLLGMDLVKDFSILEKAYNDDKKVTDKFNKNILRVVNNMMGSNLNTNDFKHHAFYNHVDDRIEMHLIANRTMTIDFPLINHKIVFKKGESIHTENSHKFNPASIKQIGDMGNLKLDNIFTDNKQWFSLSLFTKNLL